MKRFFYIFLYMLPLGLSAQNMYETAPLMQNDLTGTSRYISMGGSMGALGADVSVMGSNPAGIAIYRSSDFAFTGSLNFSKTKSKYNGYAQKDDNVQFDMESFGAVIANKVYSGGSLKYLNFGVGYRRKNGLANEFTVAGPANGFSQQHAIMDLYDRNPFTYDNISFKTFRHSWLPLLAVQSNLVDIDGKSMAMFYEPTNIEFVSEEKGGSSEVDINLSANINDRFYFGATLSFVDVDYTVNTVYYEDDDAGEIYSLGNYSHIEGHGMNIKLGAIVRPFKYSPFKIGLAVHTPTWYRLENCYYADIWGPGDNDFWDTRDYELFDDVLVTKSRFNSPWRFIASASYTFDTFMALNFDYEYADYSSASYSSVGAGDKHAQNEEIECNMKGQHILRAGVEVNLGSGLALRGGYNYSTAPFRKNAYKEMLNMPVTSASTEYNNRYSKEAVTIGGGYKGKTFYFDVAYVYDTQEADFYPYFDPYKVNPAAEMEYSNHTITATFGMRF